MRLKMLSLAAVVALMASGAQARAQAGVSVQNSASVRGVHRHHRAKMRKALFKGITLSAAQKTQLKAIHTSYRSQFQALRAQRVQGAAPDSAQRARLRSLRSQEQAQVRGVLTVDQQAIFDRNVANLQAKRAAHADRDRKQDKKF